MPRPFQQVNVFGAGKVDGNPLAVVVDSEGLSTDEMLAFTRWMNLSETAFLLPPTQPGADYRVRIFTLVGELPFAGHPTLGSCHVWLSTLGRDHAGGTVVQECGAGLVPIRRSDPGLAFAAPPLLREGPVDPGYLDGVLAILGVTADEVVDSQWVDNGPGWVGVLLRDAEAVLAVQPDVGRHQGDDRFDIGIVGAYPPGSECAFEVRALFTEDGGGMREDPVTGSLNASLGQWLFGAGYATAPYVAAQGTRLGRSGRAHIDQDTEGQVWVGGATVTLISGEVDL